MKVVRRNEIEWCHILLVPTCVIYCDVIRGQDHPVNTRHWTQTDVIIHKTVRSTSCLIPLHVHNSWVVGQLSAALARVLQ